MVWDPLPKIESIPIDGERVLGPMGDVTAGALDSQIR